MIIPIPAIHQLLPLNKLLKYPRGKKHVAIDANLLPKLDLSELRSTIHFDFDHNFKVAVSVIPDPTKNRFQVQMSMSPDYSDWPEPTGPFLHLYCAALGVAAKRASVKDEPDRFCRHFVVARKSEVILFYELVVVANGSELTTLLRRKLDLIRDELPSVVGVLAGGPAPGTTLEGEDD